MAPGMQLFFDLWTGLSQQLCQCGSVEAFAANPDDRWLVGMFNRQQGMEIGVQSNDYKVIRAGVLQDLAIGRRLIPGSEVCSTCQPTPFNFCAADTGSP